MEISEDQRRLLEQQWNMYGDCRTCGWLCAYYEVSHIVESKFLQKDFEEDGSIHVTCCANNGEDNSDHRGSNIYDFSIQQS